ncbi:MAG TPA: hypothetical protein VFZ53_00350 [Polyangiaceae bacterium]
MQKPPAQFAGVRSATSPLGKAAWTFDGVLRRVLGLSRAAELEGDRRRESKTEGSASDALRIFARSLDGEILQKLETLMRAGRDARPLGPTSATLSERGPAESAEGLFDDRLASAENLRRGHAIACATRFDLESGIAGWRGSLEGGSLDERVWLRFGRELALSTPSDWSCLAQVGKASGSELEALYLRRGDGPWWSFDTLIDRPSVRTVSRRLEHLRLRRSRLVTLPLDSVVGRRCRKDRPALRRAAMAMSARLGVCRGT